MSEEESPVNKSEKKVKEKQTLLAHFAKAKPEHIEIDDSGENDVE